MKALMIRNGDLVVSGGRVAVVRGTSKIRQDLTFAIGEDIGNDRFHPGWGSELRNFLLQIVNEDTAFEIEAEIRRVVSNYSAVQRDRIEADIYSDATTSRFVTSEILAAITSIAVTPKDDSVRIAITLRAESGEIVVMNEVVT